MSRCRAAVVVTAYLVALPPFLVAVLFFEARHSFRAFSGAPS